MQDCAELDGPSQILDLLRAGLPRWEGDLDQARSSYWLTAFSSGAPCLERLARVGLRLIAARRIEVSVADVDTLGLGECAREYRALASRLRTPTGQVQWSAGIRALGEAAQIRNPVVHGRATRRETPAMVRSFLKRLRAFCESTLAEDLVRLEKGELQLLWMDAQSAEPDTP